MLRNTSPRGTERDRRAVAPMAIGGEVPERINMGSDVQRHMNVFGEHLEIRLGTHDLGKTRMVGFHAETWLHRQVRSIQRHGLREVEDDPVVDSAQQ